MLKHLSTYQEYMNFLIEKEKENRDLFKLTISSSIYSKALFKMIMLDVDAASKVLRNLYSSSGRPSINQIEIFRSIVLMVHFNCLSFKNWTRRLKEEPILSILSGFDSDSIPSFSSFYDFVNRLYKDNPSHIHEANYFRQTNKKPQGKHQKLENYKPESVNDLYEKYISPDFKEELAEDNLLEIFNKVAVEFSRSKGLIDEKMVISGDGTAIWAHSNPYGSKIKDSDNRYYSDVDGDYGYDSDLEKFYFGYTGYNLSIHNKLYKVDLPVFLSLTKASQHDALTSIKTLATFSRINSSFKPTHICLDSASDNYATFNYAYHLNMIPIIDLNKRRLGQNVYAQYNDISEKGRPICQNGLECVPYGRDIKRQRHKFRCPYYKNFKECNCPFKDTCTKSNYGRVFYIKFEKDIRLFGAVPYKSDEWKKLYKNRTSTERINTRILNDYNLKDLRMHGRRLYFMILITTGINIHLDAYYKTCTDIGLTK